MVSQDSRSAASRDRLMKAAAAEFAGRGFAGAKVDRIAARARLNKAMIYYHFRNKAALYRAVLADVFRTIADAVTADTTDGTAEDQLRAFVRTIARETGEQPHFAPMWLRELADGGRHIDASILAEMRRILGVLGAIMQRGEAAGLLHSAHPVVVQVSIVGPILMFAASAPARERLAGFGEPFSPPPLDVFFTHMEEAALGALRVPPGDGRRRAGAAPDEARGAAPISRRKRR